MWRIVKSIHIWITLRVFIVVYSFWKFTPFNNIFTKRYIWMCFKPGLRKNKIDIEKQLQFFFIDNIIQYFSRHRPRFLIFKRWEKNENKNTFWSFSNILFQDLKWLFTWEFTKNFFNFWTGWQFHACFNNFLDMVKGVCHGIFNNLIGFFKPFMLFSFGFKLSELRQINIQVGT